MKTVVWAHRGSSFVAPENTLEAFELAAKQHADGIELDIHLTADQQLAVFHDETLERTTNGTGKVEQFTLPQLKRLNAAVLKPQYAGARIPSLPEVLDFLKGTSLRLNIEIKEEADPNPALVKLLAKQIQESGLVKRTMYCSFNHYSLMELRKVMPEACIGLLYHGGFISPWTYAKTIGANCLHPSFRFGLMSGQVENAHKEGIRVNVWTVDDPDDMLNVYEQGADGIITNKPDLALRLRDTKVG